MNFKIKKQDQLLEIKTLDNLIGFNKKKNI